MDKQRLHHLAQRHRLQYPTAQYAQQSNDGRQPPASQQHPEAQRPFGQTPAFAMGGSEAGAARVGGVGWLPAESASDRRDAGGKGSGERAEQVYGSQGAVVEHRSGTAVEQRSLRATDHKGHAWSVRDEMVIAQADKERAQRKHKRLEEEEEAREVERKKARELERRQASARSEAGSAVSGAAGGDGGNGGGG